MIDGHEFCQAIPKRTVPSESALREEADVGHEARKAVLGLLRFRNAEARDGYRG